MTREPKMKAGNKVNEFLKSNTGVKRKDFLTGVIFVLELHYFIRHLKQRGKIFNKTSQICASTDDRIIVARSR